MIMTMLINICMCTLPLSGSSLISNVVNIVLVLGIVISTSSVMCAAAVLITMAMKMIMLISMMVR